MYSNLQTTNNFLRCGICRFHPIILSYLQTKIYRKKYTYGFAVLNNILTSKINYYNLKLILFMIFTSFYFYEIIQRKYYITA